MKTLNLALAALLAIAAFGFSQDSQPADEQDADTGHANHWVADFDKAVAQAKKEKKDLFVDFTGSDWCGWCIRLHKEVFDHDEFLDAATKDFVLVALDFPRSPEVKAKVPNPQRNEELSQKYKIQGFPTILLMTPEGEVFGRTGYRPGGAEAYVTHIKELTEKGKKTLVAVAALEKEIASAEGEAKLALVDKAIKMLAEMDAEAAGANRLAAIAKQAFTLDPNNEKGLKKAAVKALLASGNADEEIVAAARALDPKNEDGLLERVVAAQCASVDSEEAVRAASKAIVELVGMGPIKDKEVAFQIYVNGAYWNHQFLKDAETAKMLAKKARTLEIDNPNVKQLLDEILGADDGGGDDK